MTAIARRVRMPQVSVLLAWCAVIWVTVFWRLGYISLLDPDEAHYAELTREMIRARQWLVPTLEGVPFIDKPVLYHWLQAAAEWLFGENEFALRLPSALAAVSLIWAVGWMGRHFADRPSGNRAALFFATTPLTFALSSIGVFDMLYTAFLFGSIGSLLVASAQGRPRLEYVGWPLLSLAVMTKGPVAVLLVLLFGVALSARRGTRPIVTGLHWRLGLSFVVLVASPWFLYMAVTFGDRFIRDYVLAGNLYYFTRPAAFSSRNSDVFFYLRTYLGGCFPWSVLVLAAAVDARLTRRASSPIEQALWTWIALVLVFFSVAGFKLDTYIYPAAPATCLLLALAWRTDIGTVPRAFSTATMLGLRCIAAILVLAGALLAATMFDIDLGLSPLALLLPGALIGGGIALAALLQRGLTSAVPAVLVGTLVAAYGVVVVEGLPVLERSRPTAPLGHWISRHTPTDEPLGGFRVDDWRGSIRFYSRRKLVVLHDASEVRNFAANHPESFTLMLARDYRRLLASGVPLRTHGGRRAIVGRSGKFIRRQLWGRIVVVSARAAGDLRVADAAIDDDLTEN